MGYPILKMTDTETEHFVKRGHFVSEKVLNNQTAIINLPNSSNNSNTGNNQYYWFWKSDVILVTFPKIISEIRYLDFFEFISTMIMSNQLTD